MRSSNWRFSNARKGGEKIKYPARDDGILWNDAHPTLFAVSSNPLVLSRSFKSRKSNTRLPDATLTTLQMQNRNHRLSVVLQSLLFSCDCRRQVRNFNCSVSNGRASNCFEIPAKIVGSSDNLLSEPSHLFWGFPPILSSGIVIPMGIFSQLWKTWQ